MTIGFLVLALVVFTSVALGQFKSTVESKPTVSESIFRPDDGGLLFGWFDPSKLTMHHTFSLSYQTFGGQGVSLGVYTNSLLYRFSDVLDVQADVSLMHSPFSSFGKQFQNNLSGIYLSRAELNYRPWKNTLLQIQYRQLPPLYWLGSSYRSFNFFDGIDRYEEDKR
jgi:hypothetical protein